MAIKQTAALPADLTEFFLPKIVEKEVRHGDITKTYFFRELTSEEAERLLDFTGSDGNFSQKKTLNLRPQIIAASLCDEDGNPVTTAAAVAKWSGVVVVAMWNAALEVNTPKKDELKA